MVKSAVWLIGGTLGLGRFSSVFAAGADADDPCRKPRIALIIDDIGRSRSSAQRFLDLDIPITYSILPRRRHSCNLAVDIRGLGHEVMLHQPMEPHNAESFDPGPGAIFVGDSHGKIKAIVEENISDVPFAIGVNNHMGSRLTESPEEIRSALNIVQRNGLFFVDSFTSGRSVAYRTARRLGMASAGRNIFLDNIPDETAILTQLTRLKRHAYRYGRAVGIGHPFQPTARAIGRFAQSLEGTEAALVHVTGVLCAPTAA